MRGVAKSHSLRFTRTYFRKFYSLSNSAKTDDEVFFRSIFAAASEQFVKSVGRRTLKPVASIDDKDNIKPYQLVVKATKRKFIFFEKAFYYPTEFQLSDVLTDKSPLHTQPAHSTLISDFNRRARLALKGKVGADIAKDVLAIELSTKDCVQVNIEFDKVSKLEAHEPLLMKEIGSRYINLNHPYIQQIRQDDSKVLCVISGVATLDTGGTIQREMEVDGTTTLKASLIKKASVSGGATYNSNKDIGLAPGTPVAYSVHELAVDSRQGTMQLVLAVGCTGGFVEDLGKPVEQTDTSVENITELDIDLRHPSKVFWPILQLPADQRESLTNNLLYLMSVPRDLQILDAIFDDIESGVMSSLSLKDLERKLLAPRSRWMGLLDIAGFQLNADVLSAPDTGCEGLGCIGEFLDAVTTLDDEEVGLLRLCSQENARLLCTVLEDLMRGHQDVDPAVSAVLTQDEVAVEILQGLSYCVLNTTIIPPTTLPFAVDETFWVLYALWGQ